MRAQKCIYIFLGPPGSGKGTLSHFCVQNLGWVQLSTGNLCRKHIAEETEIGKQIDFALKSGKLVSDSLINAMVYEWFVSVYERADNIILDGYPRTLRQAKALYTFLKENLPEILINIVRFTISDELVINRICGRLVCKNKDCQAIYFQDPRSDQSKNVCKLCSSELGRRNDDVMETIQERLQTYHRYEKDLLDFYNTVNLETKHLIVEKPLNEVVEDFKKLVGINRA